MSTVEDPGTPLLFDLPFTADPARLDNPELGLTRVIALAGRDASYAAEVTLLDVADHRLIRSGIELAHRVIDGRGDWHLRAPAWQPLLPAERVEPFAYGDLPQELADLVMPFRRRGALGPVAAITDERQSFEFRGPDGPEPLAWLRDDRVTVRRGGVITARFREVRIEPGPAGLSRQQRQWLTAALTAAGGTAVDGFPPLAMRLGTPATGLTDYPTPRRVNEDSGFETFVQAVLAGRLRELIAADLGCRSGDTGALGRLRRIVDGLRAELNGLASALMPDWLAELDEELGWFAGALADVAGDQADPERLRSTLRRERYLRLLDLLVTAVRGPEVDENSAALPAGETLVSLLDDALDKLIKAAGRLSPGSAGAAWVDAAGLAEEVSRIDGLARMVVAKKDRRLAKRLRPVVELLQEVRNEAEQADRAQDQARFATPADAFELGRRYQRHRQRQAAAQEEFFTSWAGLGRKVHG